MKKGRGVPASATETLLTAKMGLPLGSWLPDGWVRVEQRGVLTVMAMAEQWDKTANALRPRRQPTAPPNGKGREQWDETANP